jgi:hypothetical protein
MSVRPLLHALFILASKAAGNDAITIASIAEPPAIAGVDGSSLRSAAEDGLRTMPASQLKRPVTVTLAVVSTSSTPAACKVNATVLDRRTGTILGIAAGYAVASENASGDPRVTVARTAVHNALQRIPDVVARAAALR